MATHSHSPDENSRYTFIVADDHPLFRAAMKQTLCSLFPDCVVIEVSDIDSLQQRTAAHHDIDLLLLDLHMPGAHGFSGLIYIHGQYPELPVMVVSANEQSDVIRRSVDYGAAGFLPKSATTDIIQQAIVQVLAGNIWLPAKLEQRSTMIDGDQKSIADVIASLTPQQFRVINMLAAGLLNKQIAYEMNITEATVKAHLTAIFRKLGVNSRTQAALAISQLDLEPPGRF